MGVNTSRSYHNINTSPHPITHAADENNLSLVQKDFSIQRELQNNS
jgi:hypothetical protein